MKRTLALLLAVIMALPLSLVSALAHGPGIGKNEIQNQSITNALNQAIPEVVVVDGDYTDTAWDKDEWLEVDKRFGAWDVEDPLALSYSYKYQLRVDTEYLYGIFQLANTSANEIKLWLNDGSVTDKYSDYITIALDGANAGDVMLSDTMSMEDADTAAGAKPAEKYRVVAKASGAGVVVEFRFFLKSFTENGTNNISHFVSVKVGEESLYYPKMELGGLVIPDGPLTSWPSNAIVIDKTDIENAESNKHLPSDVTIDGQLNEVVWSYLTDYRFLGSTSHQQMVEVENGTSSVLDLLSIGYSNDYQTQIRAHVHDSYNCYTKNAYQDGGNDNSYYEIPVEEQLRFKYEIRTDGTNLYCAVVLYSKSGEFIDHNIPSNYSNNGHSNWEETYQTTSTLQLNFWDSAVTKYVRITYDDANGSAKFEFINHDGSDVTKTVTSGGKTETTNYTDLFAQKGKYAGATRQNDHLVCYEFKLPLSWLYCDDSKNGTIKDNTYATFLAYKEPKFDLSTIKYLTYYGATKPTSGTYTTQKMDDGTTHYFTYDTSTTKNADDIRVYAMKESVPIPKNSMQLPDGYSGCTYYTNGSLSANEWNALLASDPLVNSSYRNNNYDAGNIETYQYDIVADYDYIYGAAILVTNSTFNCDNDSAKANIFRLWLNTEEAESMYSTSYDYCVGFYLDGDNDTRVSVVSPGKTTIYEKNDVGYFQDTNNPANIMYGLDAHMRILTVEDDFEDIARQTRSPALLDAIQNGYVAVVEFRIPLDEVGEDFPYAEGGTKEVLAYYTSFEDCVNAGKGIVHPMQTQAGDSSYWRVFTPTYWSTSNDKNFYNNSVFDNIVVDGVRTESFWNTYDEFTTVNGATGYYGSAVNTSDIFTYGQTIFVSRDHLYGFTIYNCDIEDDDNAAYYVYINSDPAVSDKATHSFKFYFEYGEIKCEARDYTTGTIGGTVIDVTDAVICAGSTVNGYTNIEFAINSEIFDPDNSGYEYTICADKTSSGSDDVISLYYPDPSNDFGERFTDLDISIYNPTAVKDGMAAIVPNGGALDNSYTFNGWANLYVVFEPVNGNGYHTENGDVYRVTMVDSVYDGNKFTVDVPEDGFLYFVYATEDDEDDDTDHNPNPTRRTALIEKYKADFTEGAIIEFEGLDLEGDDLTHTKYRVMDSDKLLYINSVDYGSGYYVAEVVTNNTSLSDHNGWATVYIAFEPTVTAGLWKAVQVDYDYNGKMAITEVPAGGFVYVQYSSALSVCTIVNGYVQATTSTEANKVIANITEGSYVHLNEFDLGEFIKLSADGSKTGLSQMSVGYIVVEEMTYEEKAERNINFPSENRWDSSVAAKIDSLKFFFPETIEIDGVLNDTGWDDSRWNEVAVGISGSLQSTDYKEQYAQDFNYYYQLRSDGEYVYVAAVLDFYHGVQPLLDENGNPVLDDDKKALYSVPHFRLWVKSNDDKYSDAISFTHLYDIREGTSRYNVDASTVLTVTDLKTSGQLVADDAFDNVLSVSDIAKYTGMKITYTGTQLRYAEHQKNGYTHPWGGTTDKYSNTATVIDSKDYNSSAFFGETEEIMESMTYGTNGSGDNWYAHTQTSGFTIADEHGRWTGVEASAASANIPKAVLEKSDYTGDRTVVEFKFKLSEIGCEDGDGFEYYVQAGSDGKVSDMPYTLIHPAIVNTPYRNNRGFGNYCLPYWRWQSDTASKYNATTEYNMMLRNNYGPVVTLGAKVTDSFGGNEDSYAIRFGGLYTEEYIRRQIVTNQSGDYKTEDTENWTDRVLQGANLDGITNYWDVAKVGIVVLPSSKLTTNDPDALKLDTKGAQSADSVGIVDWVQDSNFADYEKYGFYVTLPIPSAQYLDMKFSFRSYVDYYDVDGSQTYYDATLERSYNQVAAGDSTMPLPGDKWTGGEEDEGGTGVEVIKPNYNGTTIAYIPLDDRPVNADRVEYLAESAGFEILMPDESLYSTTINYPEDKINGNYVDDEYQSSVGNPKALLQWLKDVENGTYGKVDYYVISLDQLFSGGLVGSRDFAGINNLENIKNSSITDVDNPANDTDGAYYDEDLAFESTIVDYLAELTSKKDSEGNKENTVVYFDSQMRLASTGEFNGYKESPHYNFFRNWAMEGRPVIDTSEFTAEEGTDEWYTEWYNTLINNYEKDETGEYILGKSIYMRDDANGDIVRDANGNRLFANGITAGTDITYTTATGASYTVDAEYIDRYLRTRERKLKITKMLFESGVIQNSLYYSIGVDDSHEGNTIQTAERAWMTAMQHENGISDDNFKIFAGIDEIGLMSMTSVVTDLYGSVDVAVKYFGVSDTEYLGAADEYSYETTDTTLTVHITGAGAKRVSSSNKNALQVLVLRKRSEDTGHSASLNPDDAYVTELIDTLKYNLANDIPTAVIDASNGTRDQLAYAIKDADIDHAKILGYSNWNTVGNTAGICLSNAIARYAYLKHSGEITDASHEGFLKQITYSLVKDIAYIAHYKGNAGLGNYCTEAEREAKAYLFNDYADDLIEKVNNSVILTALGETADIGDVIITKELYWPWNRIFEASFGLDVVANYTNVNLAKGKSYEFQGTIHDTWPDDGGELTDGEYPAYATSSSSDNSKAYIGTRDGSNATITFDLGTACSIAKTKAVTAHGFWGISMISDMRVFVSTDGVNYTPVSGTKVCEVKLDGENVIDANSDTPANSYRCYTSFYFDEAVTAQYIKIELVPSGYFVLVNEVEVYEAE